MRKVVKKIGLSLAALVFVFLISVNFVFAAGTTTTTFGLYLGGNGYYTGRGSEEGEFAIAKGKSVKLTTTASYYIKPNTSSHKMTLKVALRRHTLIGYSTVLSYNVFDGDSLGNSSTTATMATSKKTKTATATVSATDGYYIYAASSGGSSNNYECYTSFTITYGVN